MPPSDPKPSPRTATLPAAMLLATSGGLLDASVYLGHGRVFVSAMTGNVVLMGIAVVGLQGGQVLRQVDVVGGYLLGLAASELLRGRPTHMTYRFAISLEVIMIGLVGLFAARVPEHALLPVLAFVSAFQVDTFRRVGPFRYNSTFLTGNMRDIVDSAVARYRKGRTEDGLRAGQRALDLSLICLAFLAGALAGAWLEALFPGHGFWFSAVPLLPVAVLAFVQGPQEPPSVRPAPTA